MSLENVISRIPFLAGYEASRQQREQEQSRQLQQAGSLMQLLQAVEKQKMQQQAATREDALRKDLSGAKTLEEAIEIGRKHGPEGLKAVAAYAEATKDLRNPATRNQVVAPGSTVLGPDNKPVFTAPATPKEEATPEIVKLLKLAETLPQGSPMRTSIERRIQVMNKDPATITNIHNPAPVTLQVVKDSTSETGWSSIDARTGRKVAAGVPAPTQSAEAAGFAGQKVTAKEMAERELNYPETTKQINIAAENIDSLKSQLKSLKMHPGLPGITGAIYGRTPSVSKNSMAAQAIYENVVNNIFVNALQAMRAASKTGGAVGNVSDREGDKLQQTLAALSRAQGTGDFQRQVDIALDRLESAKKNIKDAYDATYEYKRQWKVER